MTKETHPFLTFVYSLVGPVDVTIQAKCNPCLSNPCKNDGTCNNDPVDFYRCTCPYGFKVNTNHSWDITLPLYVFFFVLCVLRAGLFYLHLTHAFLLQGQDCDIPIHACISNPCKHGGTCHLKEGENDGFW